ncbi:MAG TPA: toll/interleukin-1 receptor domain-containing protein [Gemmataceae bacterium]|nr:toll/interleukin-1 receptor domain-containing protein [Gemmataceae bacterium]
MAKRAPPPPPWSVRRDADSLRHAFFVSHVAEDEAEVVQLKAEIEAYSGRGGRAPLACFLDVQNWLKGNLSGMVIRESLRRSAHMVAWISPAYIATTRGWVWMELAYAELIELAMNHGQFDLAHPFIVPVFRGVTVEHLARTPWLDYWQRSVVAPHQAHPTSDIARHLVDFHEQEAGRRDEGTS